MLDRKSKIFFSIFFGLILISVAVTYYRLEILEDFHAFTEDEDIPRAVDFYLNLVDQL